LRIAIDYTPAYEQGAGIGRYVRELVSHLAIHDDQTAYRLFVAGAKPSQLPEIPGPNFVWKTSPITRRWFIRLWYRLHIPWPVQMFTGSVDLYHATDFFLPPIAGNTPTLLTVHDLSFVRVPETAIPRLKQFLDEVVPRSVERATHVLADSTATKNDLIELYGTPADKITVLLSGVEARFNRVETGYSLVREKYNIPDGDFILTVGTVQPRKNYVRLIEAVARLNANGHEVHLVIAGGPGWLSDPIFETIQLTGSQAYVHLVGFVDDADLPTLYSDAVCVAFPSLYEGFGFPILEGMACGTPVVTSNLSSMPEAAGDAALLVDPYDVDAITDALRRLLTDEQLRQTLIRRGYRQAKTLTWERSAAHLKAIYQQILSPVDT
jgi:glycosyltransferase involved in cell wall biosynthesis